MYFRICGFLISVLQLILLTPRWESIPQGVCGDMFVLVCHSLGTFLLSVTQLMGTCCLMEDMLIIFPVSLWWIIGYPCTCTLSAVVTLIECVLISQTSLLQGLRYTLYDVVVQVRIFDALIWVPSRMTNQTFPRGKIRQLAAMFSTYRISFD